MTGDDHRSQVQLRPAVAMLTVGRHLMLVFTQVGEGTEVEHLVAGRVEAGLWDESALSRDVSRNGSAVGISTNCDPENGAQHVQ